MREHGHYLVKDIVVLQNCIMLLKGIPGSDSDLKGVPGPDSDLKGVPGSGSETCHDVNQVIYVKAEDVTDTQEEEEMVEDPLLITLPAIKVEREVSCVLRVYIVGHISQILIIAYFFLISSCPSAWNNYIPFQNF
jgi:hypothetical protein